MKDIKEHLNTIKIRKKALNLAKNQVHLSDDFLKKTCPNIVNGINTLKDWIGKNSS